jgi:endonuclease G, mitochondrial
MASLSNQKSYLLSYTYFTMIENIKKYGTRTFIFGSVSLLLLYIFLPNTAVEATCKTIGTPKLYVWKEQFFSKGIKKNDPETEGEKLVHKTSKSEKEDDSEANDANTATEQDSKTDGKSSKNTKNPQDTSEMEDFELPTSSYKEQLVRHTYYTLLYSEEHEQARWVAYKLTKSNISQAKNRDGEQFKPDKMVTTGSALPNDYASSGFDRGHLAPAGDFSGNNKMMDETFFMSNMSPQYPAFNRQTWRLLEEQVRRWEKKASYLYVISGPLLKGEMKKIGKKNQISVPTAYFKIIMDWENKKTIAFLIPNKDIKEDYKQYITSIDKIEKETGLNFFPKLKSYKELQTKLEATTNTMQGFKTATTDDDEPEQPKRTYKKKK